MKNLERINAKAVLKSAISFIEKSSLNKGIVQNPTGFMELDRYLQGLLDGELTVIASRPAIGKSALMMNIAMNCMMETDNPRPVIIVTGLTSATQYMLTVISYFSSINTTKIRRGELNDTEWKKLLMILPKIKNLPLYVDDAIRTINQLENLIEQVSAVHGTSPIVAIDDIDYLHLHDHEFFAKHSQTVVGKLKEIAQNKQLPILFTAKVSKDSEARTNTKPQLRDIEYILHYESLVDKILLVYRDEVCTPDSDYVGLAEVIIAKNSIGNNDIVLLKFEGQYEKFSNHTFG